MASDVPSPSDANPSARTSLNVSTVCGTPSSSIAKSSAESEATGSPRPFTTVTSTRTRLAPLRNTGGCGGCCACSVRPAAQIASANELEADIPTALHAGGGTDPVCDGDVQMKERCGEPQAPADTHFHGLIAEAFVEPVDRA